MIKLSDYVMNFVSGLKVKHIFLLPGGGCMHLVDSLGKCANLKYICCLHEQAAAIAAEAYSQYTNNLGVVLVTSGPGSTNTLTAVAAAWIDSTPLLVISGQVKRSDMIKNSGVRQMGAQEVDIVSIVKPITKYCVTIDDPASIKYHLQRGVYFARDRRSGPVWLDIPLDVQGAIIDESKLKGFNPTEEKPVKGLSRLVDRSILLLNKSKRPVILAGNGIRLSGALKDFVNLTKILKIPVLTTWKAMDFLPEDDKLFFGRPGSIGQRGANFVQQNSDFIMVIGARLDLAQAGYNYKRFAPFARKVIVDIDSAEIRKTGMKIDAAVYADAKLFIRELINRKNKIKSVGRARWIERCLEWKTKYPVVLLKYFKPKKLVNTYVLIDTLSKLMSKNDILVPGSSGSCSEITMQAFKVKRGERIINSPGLGSMGFGLPASIGACLASGKKRTIAIIGDGGLQHNIQELETLKRLNLPIKLFVLNNNGYASIRNTHKRFFNGRLVCCDPSSGLTLPDTCKVASAYGLKTLKITSQRNLSTDLLKVLETAGTVVCEVMVDPDLQTAPRVSSQATPEGSMVSMPMEDLWPFLDREEFKANMIIPPLLD